MLEFLLFRTSDPQSPELKLLSSISELLLNDDQTKRPGADKVLAMLPRDTTTAMRRPVPEVKGPSAIHTEFPIRSIAAH